MWELDHKEGWVLKNWCFWTRVLGKTLESPLDCRDTQLVHPEGNQSWMFIGRTDAEAEIRIFWPPDVKSWLIWKDPDAGKDWRREAKGTTGWDGWMASLTQWTWVWVGSRSWWWTGRPGVLQSTGAQSWTWLSKWTVLNWTRQKNCAPKTIRCWWNKEDTNRWKDIPISCTGRIFYNYIFVIFYNINKYQIII